MKHSENSFSKLIIIFSNDEPEVIAYTICAVIQSCDPTLSDKDAQQTGADITDSFGNSGTPV